MAVYLGIGYGLIAAFLLYIIIAIEVDSRLQAAEYEAFYEKFYRSRDSDANATAYPVTVHRGRHTHDVRRMPRRYSLTVK